jgi:hypothetical protein
VGLHLKGGAGGSAVQPVVRLDLQLAIEGQELEEVRPNFCQPLRAGLESSVLSQL